MRILYLDIDSLRPDHLGCYGYHRNTSPNIDQLAAGAVRFENVYASDTPCLPSRTALATGRFGIHTGVVGHGGTAADPFHDGPSRAFQGSRVGRTSFMRGLRDAGYTTATVSSFAERHSAWHWYSYFGEVVTTGKGGMEVAHEVAPLAEGWLRRNAERDDWFLHVNFWDPHLPYRTPAGFGEPFADAPLPAWLTDEVRAAHWQGCGPHSAQETIHAFNVPTGFTPEVWASFPRQPSQVPSMREVRMMFDGYDTGVLYTDRYIGELLNALADAGVLDETAVIVSADHGENLGELNVYGDHHTADQFTARVPLIVRWPGVSPRVDAALHYQFDFAATLLELVGGSVPEGWDAQSFAPAFRAGTASGRDALVLSYGAWSCQRAVRFGDHIAIRSYHDGYHGFPDAMLFNLQDDPHEQRNLAEAEPALVARALGRLETWQLEMMRSSTHPTDPMWTVLHEGGPYHVRGELPLYLKRLRDTGRSRWADWLEAKHPEEARGGASGTS